MAADKRDSHHNHLEMVAVAGVQHHIDLNRELNEVVAVEGDEEEEEEDNHLVEVDKDLIVDRNFDSPEDLVMGEVVRMDCSVDRDSD